MIVAAMKSGSVEAGEALILGSGNHFSVVHTAQRKQFVLLEGDVGINVQFHVLRFQRSDTDGYFQTAVAHGADISQQCIVGERRDTDVVEVKHVRRLGVVIIGGEQQAVAEHSQVDTCIEGMFHFPFQIGVCVAQVA